LTLAEAVTKGTLTGAVAVAIDEVERLFAPHAIIYVPDGSGGANVIIENLALGELYAQETTWLGFHVAHVYPKSHVYPHFARGDLRRRDERALGAAISSGHVFLERPAVQLSRKTDRWDGRFDTAAIKTERVLEWLRTHP
jgi:hypothetical protein